MSNLRNLKQPIDKFRGIGISHDLQPKEREENKRMVEEAKQLHIDEEAGDGSLGNFRFLVVGYGQKKRVIKIRRNTDQPQN